MFFLIFLKKIIQGSKLDRIFRILINQFAHYYYNLSSQITFTEKTKFIYICYGGLGDCILAFPFLIKLSARYQLTIFIDNNFKELTYLLPKNMIVKNYIKKDLIKELKIFSSLNNNYVLIQQSPIAEFIFFHYFLKKPATIGFIYAQNIISFEGVSYSNQKVNSLNKIFKYNKLLELILLIKNKNNLKSNILDYQYKTFNYKYLPSKKYYILSPTKNHNWKMGFLELKVYADFIIKMNNENNLIPVIIGTKSDSFIINRIMDHIPKNLNIKNLVGKTLIKDLIPLLNKAEFVIANDNGIHHLSNFLKKPTLTLYNFSSYEVYNWSNKNSEYIFNPIFSCMPCIGKENGPFDNIPFKCPWNIRCKNTIDENNIFRKLEDLKWID